MECEYGYMTDCAHCSHGFLDGDYVYDCALRLEEEADIEQQYAAYLAEQEYYEESHE